VRVSFFTRGCTQNPKKKSERNPKPERNPKNPKKTRNLKETQKNLKEIHLQNPMGTRTQTRIRGFGCQIQPTTFFHRLSFRLTQPKPDPLPSLLLAGAVREEETERRKREGRKGIKKEEKKVGEIFKLENFLG
jgi:hypothetical protein